MLYYIMNNFSVGFEYDLSNGFEGFEGDTDNNKNLVGFNSEECTKAEKASQIILGNNLHYKKNISDENKLYAMIERGTLDLAINLQNDYGICTNGLAKIARDYYSNLISFQEYKQKGSYFWGGILPIQYDF